MQQVFVIGAGVSGLTSGLRLQEAGFHTTILTRELPRETTSAAAGAVWWGWLEGRQREWAEVSLKEFQRLATVVDSGISEIELRDIDSHPAAEPWFKDLIPACVRIPHGFLITVPLIETPRYLGYLKACYERLGGKIEQREIGQISELYGENRLIVNCTGVGARQVANDPDVFPVRGQTVRVRAESIGQAYMNDESFTYIFPRKDCVILGGVAQPNNWSREVDPADTNDILSRCEPVEPSLRGAEILGYTVGLRPGRYVVRLEHERVSESCGVIHNYGHGGVGYTLSWGCAADVLALVRQIQS